MALTNRVQRNCADLHKKVSERDRLRPPRGGLSACAMHARVAQTVADGTSCGAAQSVRAARLSAIGTFLVFAATLTLAIRA